MAKISRQPQKIFASAAGTNQLAEIGSLNAGTPVFTTNIITMQSLSNYLTGLFGVVIGGNSPAIEDINSLFYLATYQLAYGLQTGVPEWDSSTTYYKGSIVTDTTSTGTLYRSITDTNLNNAVTDTVNWRIVCSPNTVAINPAISSPVTIAATDNFRTFDVNTVNGACTFVFPAPVLGFTFTIKDVGGVCGNNNMTFQQHASETLENLAASFIAKKNYGSWSWYCDGTNFWLV